MTPAEVVEFCKNRDIGIIDLKFTDVPGTLQHLSLPLSELNEENLADGYGFDGSSIRGFKAIQESDMLLIPDTNTAVVDPFCQVPTLTMLCNIMEPETRELFSRDPRYISQKAESFLKDSGIADISYWGPEAEHFIFDSARFDQTSNSGYYFVDSDEGIWNSGSERSLQGGPNLAYRPRYKEGYFPTPPTDTYQDIRSECVQKMEHFGIVVEKHHHEVATAGQAEIDMRYDSLTNMADKVILQKYIVKNVAHAPALLAFIAPTTNSYRRLVPGFEAPVNLVYSTRNRSACIRIPVYFSSPASRRIEFRLPDPSC